MSIKFNYYYGKEAEQFSFFRIPKLLFTDPLFAKLSRFYLWRYIIFA
ncbi:MAG TPA: hypothetical protein VIG61_06800 [Fusobacterium sp.]